MASLGKAVDARQVRQSILAVTQARDQVRTACDHLTDALATLAPLGAGGAETAAHYQRALDILLTQLVVLDNAIATIAD